MKYIMVTGPMGAGKSTFMRSLSKPQGEFIMPENVPDMMLDYSCELREMRFYEIDAPTATGKAWINWLKAADIQLVIGNGLKEPDENFIELWNYLVQNTPDTQRFIILNRTNKITDEWKTYATEKIMCVGIGETINEETAIASENDISTIITHLEEYNE